MKIVVIGGGPAGLYFGLLMKKAGPQHQIRIIERNRRNETFGWGVVFSDETLGHFLDADPQTHSDIRADFVHWDAIDTHVRGQVIRSAGHGFCGIARRRLLHLLEARCTQLGIRIDYETEVDGLGAFADADLIVAADGINSKVRTVYAEQFQPDIEIGTSKFIWLGTTKVFDAFKFFIEVNDHGVFQVHAYPFDAETSTFIVETDERAWRSAGLDKMSIEQGVKWCEGLFARYLDGHSLLTNKSDWINFRRIKNATWHHDNIVLIGDAAHTAHFSIGSGTKLAMEDSIALVAALREHSDVPTALRAYQDARWVEVAKLQKSATTSRHFFENTRRYRNDEPLAFTINMMTRSKRVTYDNLRVRDPAFIAQVTRSFAERNGWSGTEPPPPPMFMPLTLRSMVLPNRVVVAPMCQYSADEGMPQDWHLVHLGSRAVGGAGLVMAEMTAVSRLARITPGCAGIYTDEQAQGWKRIVDFVHGQSQAKIGLQLGHAGRKGATRLMWEGMDQPLVGGGWPLLSASAIPYFPASQVPKAMDRDDMDDVRDAFVAATTRAVLAGFDLLELHMAHGYLLASFISPLTNHRADDYGGDIEHRMRFPLEVFDAVRAVWPAQQPMSARISATDWAKGGLSASDAVAVAQMLRDHQCDLISVSTGQTVCDAEPVFGRMYQTPFSDQIRHEVGVPTVAAGAIQGWDHANTIIASGRADLCAMARPHLADPFLTLRAASEQAYEGDAVRWPSQYLAGKPRPPR